MGELPLGAAVYQGRSIVRTVRRFHPKVKLYPAVFVDKDLRRYFDPLDEGAELVGQIRSDGLLIGTYDKSIGMGLLDYFSLADITGLVSEIHKLKKEIWVAGSVTQEEMPQLWEVGVDVIWVRNAACIPGRALGRFGQVDKDTVAKLVASIPQRTP